MIFFLTQSLKKFFSLNENKAFDEILALRGETFRALENRRTQRIQLDGQAYFLKQHYGIGWKEIFKNLLQLRLPILGAKSEWLAINAVKALNIPTQTIVGYGERGWHPAHRQSFLLTESLPKHQSLEEIILQWQLKPPTFQFKQQLINQIAHIARTLHQNGINHRDFYLCHFLLADDTSQQLFLIDLHRAQRRRVVPERWLLKDLAGLYFSTKAVKLTDRDFLRFMRAYRKRPLRDIFKNETGFWQKVKQRGDKLYQRHGN